MLPRVMEETNSHWCCRKLESRKHAGSPAASAKHCWKMRRSRSFPQALAFLFTPAAVNASRNCCRKRITSYTRKKRAAKDAAELPQRYAGPTKSDEFISCRH